jgi:chromosome segregation ATPase
MVEWVQEGTDATTRSSRRKPARSTRDDGETREAALSARTLMGRLERQSGQVAILKSKLEETTRELEQQREEGRLLRSAFEDERAGRERLQAQAERDRAARVDAERSAEEAHVTASALEGKLQLLRAQVKALEHETGRRRRFGVPWRR